MCSARYNCERQESRRKTYDKDGGLIPGRGCIWQDSADKMAWNHPEARSPRNNKSHLDSRILEKMPTKQDSKTFKKIEEYIGKRLKVKSPTEVGRKKKSLPLPQIERQYSLDESVLSKSRQLPAKSQEFSILLPEIRAHYNCYIDSELDSDITVSCDHVADPSMSRSSISDDDDNFPPPRKEWLKIHLGNIKKLPQNGKIVVTVDLPSSLVSKTVQIKPRPSSTVVEVMTHSPVGKNMWITENVTVTKTSSISQEKLHTTTSKDFLTVDDSFRRRSNSDSRMDKNRPKPSTAKQLPGIKIDKVEDFSSRKEALRKALKDQPDELRMDLDDNAEFFSLLNCRRRRSYTCPEDVLITSPNCTDIH